jgi:hypothetical protein
VFSAVSTSVTLGVSTQGTGKPVPGSTIFLGVMWLRKLAYSLMRTRTTHPQTAREKMTSPEFTGKRAIALNLQKDGLKIRAASFKNRKKYNRKDKSWHTTHG